MASAGEFNSLPNLRSEVMDRIIEEVTEEEVKEGIVGEVTEEEEAEIVEEFPPIVVSEPGRPLHRLFRVLFCCGIPLSRGGDDEEEYIRYDMGTSPDTKIHYEKAANVRARVWDLLIEGDQAMENLVVTKKHSIPLKIRTLPHTTLGAAYMQKYDYIIPYVEEYALINGLEVVPEQLYFLANDIINTGKLHLDESKLGKLDLEVFIQILKKYPDLFFHSASVYSFKGSKWLALFSCRPDFPLHLVVLELKNCRISCKQVMEILIKCKNLEGVSFNMKTENYGFYLYDKHSPIGTTSDMTSLKQYRKSLKRILHEVVLQVDEDDRPRSSKLKRISMSLPYLKACTVASYMMSLLFEKLELEILEICCSQKDTLLNLLTMKGNKLDDIFLADHKQLDCYSLLEACRRTLKKLAIHCNDRFPLEWLRAVPTDRLNVGYSLKHDLTVGLLSGLIDHESEHPIVLPNLEELSLCLPLLKLVPNWEDNVDCKEAHARVRSLMLMFFNFWAANTLSLKRRTLEGLRPQKMMLPWLKDNLCGYRSGVTSLGVMYDSGELQEQLYEYNDELNSLGIIIRVDNFRGSLHLLLNPSKEKKEYQFVFVKTLHIFNQLSTLQTFSVDSIVNKFPKLSTLIIEDFGGELDALKVNSSGDAQAEDMQGYTFSKAKLKDSDLKAIIQKLSGTLKTLHLNCDLKSISDEGVAGLSDKRVGFSLARGEKRVSLCYISGLRYLYLKGLGDKVTDRSAMLCFSEAFSFPKLQELHLFAPNMTEKGRNAIRTNYSNRRGFILEVV